MFIFVGMKAKEKAQELFDKMFDNIPDHCDSRESAKRCALNAVDGICLNCYDDMDDYWQEVKREIENL